MKKILAIFFVVIASLILLKSLRPSKPDGDFDFDRASQLPVLQGGRFKPLDSVARTSLLLLRGKQYVTVERDGKNTRVTAREWMIRTMLSPHSTQDYQIFRIDHGELQGMLGVTNNQQKYFSYNELYPHFNTIDTQAGLVSPEAEKRTPLQKAIVKLRQSIFQYQQITMSLRPHAHDVTVSEKYQIYQNAIISSAQYLSGNDAPNREEPVIQALVQLMQEFESMPTRGGIQFIPYGDDAHSWMHLSEGLTKPDLLGKIPEVILLYGELADAFEADDLKAANQTVGKLEKLYESHSDLINSTKIRWEFKSNLYQPFTLSIQLYLVVLLTIIVGWVAVSRRCLTVGFWILFATFAIHTIGLILRMWLQGRPPITNLYSSAVFIGWGAPLICLMLERFFKYGFATAVGAVSGLLSMIVAHHLMATGDTMEMMRAVLDSNFWLTTHVIAVTLGYVATFVAGLFGILYVVLGVFTKMLDQKMVRALSRMVYGVVCFALLFSFVGTFLGGIWADQSWGRFWGWDPKENGALMIVVWNALILHCRRGGIAKERGIMLLAILGNIITAWSWFGTNMLGVGLHSYGFMDSAFFWLLTFWISQLAIVALGGWIPLEKWRSYSLMKPGKS